MHLGENYGISEKNPVFRRKIWPVYRDRDGSGPAQVLDVTRGQAAKQKVLLSVGVGPGRSGSVGVGRGTGTFVGPISVSGSASGLPSVEIMQNFHGNVHSQFGTSMIYGN